MAAARGSGAVEAAAEEEEEELRRAAAAHATRQREGGGVGARAGEHRQGAVPPRAQLTYVGGVEQLLGPQQHAVARLAVHRDHPTSP